MVPSPCFVLVVFLSIVALLRLMDVFCQPPRYEVLHLACMYKYLLICIRFIIICNWLQLLTVFAINCSSKLVMEKICLSVMGDGTSTIRSILFLLLFSLEDVQILFLVFPKSSSIFGRNLLVHVR